MTEFDLTTVEGRLKFLRTVPFFQDNCFNDRILTDIASAAKLATFTAGQTVIFRETMATNCFVVADGELEVQLPHAPRIGVGQIVGHVGALSRRGWKRACDVITTSSVVLVEISFEDLIKHTVNIMAPFYEVALAFDREGVDLVRQITRRTLPATPRPEAYGPGLRPTNGC